MTDAALGHGADGVAVGAGLGVAKVAQDLRDRGYAITGAHAPVVLTLRSRFDSDRVRAVLEADQRIVIVGADWFGLEVAAAARAAGCSMTVIHAAGPPPQSVIGAELGAFFAGPHRSRGVGLCTPLADL